MDSYNKEDWLLDLLPFLTLRQTKIEDFNNTFNYYKKIIETSLDVLEKKEEYQNDISLIAFVPMSAITNRLTKNIITSDAFEDIVNNYLIEKADYYKEHKYDFVFACWYIGVINALKILLRDLHTNADNIEKLANLANKYASRMEGIKFENKGLLIQ